MSRQEEFTRLYLGEPSITFWRWQDGGNRLTWADGQTICTREQLREVLVPMASRGLPPMSAVLLVLAASDASWEKKDTGRDLLLNYLHYLENGRKQARSRSRGIQIDIADSSLTRRLEGVIEGLDRVHRLPESRRTDSACRARLLEVIFEPATRRLEPEVAQRVLDFLESYPRGLEISREVDQGTAYRSLVRDLESLEPGLADLDEERLALRERTGLDELVEVPDLDLPVPDKVRWLLGRLEEDQELGGLARLATRMIAALHVPRPLASPEELPTGGFTDISNRGPLHRLLLTELAHDDLTLATRVALGEALYLRRELPSRRPPLRRIVLVDCGIRLWGISRVYATAVAMALASSADAAGSVDTWRTAGHDITPSDFTRREGLIDHLGALETHVHPGPALRALETRYAGRSDAEKILVTHRGCREDRDMRGFLETLPDSLHVVSVDDRGDLRHERVSRRGATLLHTARMSLEELQPRGSRLPGSHLMPASPIWTLPAILFADPFPLRVPHQVRIDRTAVSPGGVAVSLTRDHRLLAWRDEPFSPRQLSDQIPRGSFQSLHFEADGTFRLILAKAAESSLVMVAGDPEQAGLHILDMPVSSRVRALCREGSTLFAVGARGVEAFDMDTGLPRATLPAYPAGMKWRRDRFFGSGMGWHLVTFQNGRIAFKGVPKVPYDALALFDRPGHDGPFGVDVAGRVFSTVDGRYLPHTPPTPTTERGARLTLGAVSRDGNRVVLVRRRGDMAEESWLINLSEGTCEVFHGDRARLIEPELVRFQLLAAQVNVRRHLASVGSNPGGELLLSVNDRSSFLLRVTPIGELRLHLSSSGPAGQRPLEKTLSPGGYRLDAARNGDTAAFLDSRGILHLKAPDMVEISLVLSEGAIGGSLSDGRFFGPERFTGPGRRIPVAEVDILLRAYGRRLGC